MPPGCLSLGSLSCLKATFVYLKRPLSGSATVDYRLHHFSATLCLSAVLPVTDRLCTTVTPTSANRRGRHVRTVIHAVYPHVDWLSRQDGNELKLRNAVDKGQRASKSQTQATRSLCLLGLDTQSSGENVRLQRRAFRLVRLLIGFAPGSRCYPSLSASANGSRLKNDKFLCTTPPPPQDESIAFLFPNRDCWHNFTRTRRGRQRQRRNPRSPLAWRRHRCTCRTCATGSDAGSCSRGSRDNGTVFRAITSCEDAGKLAP
eukprot:IDg8846t1